MKKLLILAPSNAALLNDTQVLIPGLQPTQCAYNGSSVTYQGRHVTAVRIDDSEARTHGVAMVSHTSAYTDVSPPCPLKPPPQFGAGCSDEDPRLIVVGDALYVIYNRADEMHRYMRIAQVIMHDEAPVRFTLSHDKWLRFTTRAGESIWEKNWSPFVYQDELHFIYQASPPLILRVTKAQLQAPGDAAIPQQVSASTMAATAWTCGEIRGGSPALYDAQLDRYVTFFHTAAVAAGRQSIAQYYIVGLYTFHPGPPFEIDRITPTPLVTREFYDRMKVSGGVKKSVVFPTGLVMGDDGHAWHMMYGKNDATLHVATWDKAKVMSQTVPAV